MTGKEILLAALRGEKTERPAWLPFVGCHGGKMLGLSAEEYLKSADHMLAGMHKARELYRPDGLPICFDLQVEAEILGCGLKWAKDCPPSVSSHPLEDGQELADLPEYSVEKGRMPAVLDVTRRAKAEMGDDVALYGLITGPFTLALHLCGNDIFLDMYDEPEEVQEVLAFCAEVGKKTALAYLEAGCDVIACVDPMTSQISPDHFLEFVSPHVNTVFDAVREAGGLTSMFVCGDAARVLKEMCDTHCHNVSIDENIPLENLRDLAVERKKSFGGNLKLTVVLLMGGPDDVRRDVVRCLDAGGDTGFILAPGCDLPYDVPEENLVVVADIIHDPYQQDVARQLGDAGPADAFEDIVLPDYSNEPGVTVDVITLDSSSCAPCQYMWDAAQRAAAAVGEGVKVVEHKIKNREGVGMMCRLDVKNIPTICIDGETAFSSIIPDQPKLIEAIRNKLEGKSAK